MRKLLPTAGFLLLGLLACAQPAARRELPQTAPQPVVIVPPYQAEARAWYWLGGKIGGDWQQVDAPSRYRIEFADARTLLLVADCNRGRADYTWAADGRFAAGPAGLTKMGCPPESQARAFLAGLATAANLRAESAWLSLESSQGLMLFAPDSTRRLAHYACPDGDSFAIAIDGESAALIVDATLQLLVRQPTSAGSHYRNAGYVFRASADGASLDAGGKLRRNCIAR